MQKKQFRFKRDYFQIKGIHNIPGLIICAGHGYDLLTYCCKACGELFVLEGNLKVDLNTVIRNKNCPTCGIDLTNNLAKYPENVFYKGETHKILNDIDLHFSETELIDIYEIKI